MSIVDYPAVFVEINYHNEIREVAITKWLDYYKKLGISIVTEPTNFGQMENETLIPFEGKFPGTYVKAYRIKTEAEFESDYGSDWRTSCDWNKKGHMDHWFGQLLSYNQCMDIIRHGVCSIEDSSRPFLHKRWNISILCVTNLKMNTNGKVKQVPKLQKSDRQDGNSNGGGSQEVRGRRSRTNIKCVDLGNKKITIKGAKKSSYCVSPETLQSSSCNRRGTGDRISGRRVSSSGEAKIVIPKRSGRGIRF